MMPNKKNPDPAELVRGRSATVIGAVTAMLALLKGLPLAYQRDLQEDKPAFFASIATLDASLGVMAGLVETLSIDRVRMRAAAEEGYTTATALADALVRRGVPFRAAHHIVGGLVGGAEAEGIATLAGLPDEAFKAALDGSDDPTARHLAKERGIAGALRAAATIEGSLASADVTGGTAPNRVAEALAAAKARLDS
jgi:argininosuccinate lyase